MRTRKLLIAAAALTAPLAGLVTLDAAQAETCVQVKVKPTAGRPLVNETVCLPEAPTPPVEPPALPTPPAEPPALPPAPELPPLPA